MGVTYVYGYLQYPVRIPGSVVCLKGLRGHVPAVTPVFFCCVFCHCVVWFLPSSVSSLVVR